MRKNLEVLSVVCDNVEYRCEQWEQSAIDMRGESYFEVHRSAWLSKHGEELDDHTAMKLFNEKRIDSEKQELINRLWPLGQ